MHSCGSQWLWETLWNVYIHPSWVLSHVCMWLGWFPQSCLLCMVCIFHCNFPSRWVCARNWPMPELGNKQYSFLYPKATTDQFLWVHSLSPWPRYPSAVTQVISGNGPLSVLPAAEGCRVSQEAAALTVLSRPWEAWHEGGCPHLTIVAGSSRACLFISVLWCHVIGLFYPFHSRATQSWGWVVLKNKTKGGKTAWEWMKSLPQFPHEQTNTKTFLFLTFKNYNWEMETRTEKSSCNSRRFHGLKKIFDVVKMKSFLN